MGGGSSNSVYFAMMVVDEMQRGNYGGDHESDCVGGWGCCDEWCVVTMAEWTGLWLGG